MCGRYALGIRASFVRHQFQQEGLPVDNAPDDEDVRQNYNFAPGSLGLVYRPEVPDQGARGKEEGRWQEKLDQRLSLANDRPAQSSPLGHSQYKYQLKAMKWGLIPSWTKRSLDHGSISRTINCRDDSLIENRGMWNSMKHRKRCIIICQGFYEWLKQGPGGKEKVPHFVKRKDEKLMCCAGLWDVVKYEDAEEKIYTFTMIKTSSTKQLQFLHHRMPVILDAGGEDMRTWLDPERVKWSTELQTILQPYKGELEYYPVSKEVGKIGNNSPNFILPLNSKTNNKNIANFFHNAEKSPTKARSESNRELGDRNSLDVEKEENESRGTIDHEGREDDAPLPAPSQSRAPERGMKREHSPDGETPTKAVKIIDSPDKFSVPTSAISVRKTKSATSNGTGPKRWGIPKIGGSQRITSFFGK